MTLLSARSCPGAASSERDAPRRIAPRGSARRVRPLRMLLGILLLLGMGIGGVIPVMAAHICPEHMSCSAWRHHVHEAAPASVDPVKRHAHYHLDSHAHHLGLAVAAPLLSLRAAIPDEQPVFIETRTPHAFPEGAFKPPRI